jgi:dihydropyrimidinase
MYDLIIAGGTIITGAGPIHAAVGINGHQIVAIGHNLAGQRVIDATGCYVIPGGVDPHVHLSNCVGGLVSTDDFTSGTIAAACGGTTTVIDFATPRPEQGLLAALAERRAEAQGTVAIDYSLHMTIPTWHGAADERLLDVPKAVAAGCATFKMYQAYAGYMLDDEALFRGLQAVGRAGGRVVLHAETGPVIEQLRQAALAAGHTTPIWHERTRPARLEATAIHRAAELAHLAGCPLFIFHVGCAEGVAEIVAARQRGVLIHGESCPQYLLLTADEHLGGAEGQLYVCAPPLRTSKDQHRLWQALTQDELQVVSTDHCPWTRAEKAQPNFALIPGGVPGIELRLAQVFHFGVNSGRLSRARWVQICCTNPARLMGLTHKGAIAPGYDADLVIFDPQRPRMITSTSLHEKADWSPYEGMMLTGWPRTVLLRGKVIVENEKYVGQAGDGRFVARLYRK